MAARRVFVISSAGLTAHHREGSKLLDPFPFPPDEEGRAHFARYLERFPNDPDLGHRRRGGGEEFREETIPHVHGRDRRALLRAKASRAFRDARYVHSARLGREPDGRRDDRMLFSAITRSDILDPWLASMARHAVPLAGIYSPATLTGGMLKAIGAEGEHVLVVSLQSGGGLRQTCFRRGRLRLSRLAVMPEPVPGRYGAGVLAEVERTRRYLGSLDAAADEGSLEVHVLSHGALLDDLRRELRRDAAGDLRTACTPVDLAGVARRLGMRRWDGEAIADRLFVHHLARRPPSNHYATREETRGFATVRARSLLRAASAALVAGGCLFGGVTILEGVIAGGHARSLATQAMLYEGRYREAQATLPLAPGRAGRAGAGGVRGGHATRPPRGPRRSPRADQPAPWPASRGCASRASGGGQAAMWRLPSPWRSTSAPIRGPPARRRGATRRPCSRSRSSGRGSSRSTATTAPRSRRFDASPACSPRPPASSTSGFRSCRST